MTLRIFRYIILGILLVNARWPVLAQQEPADPLSYPFNGKYGQVEVGGRYAGAEFHDSRPLPSRISFYYPVANSIDLSTDYWKRGDSRPFAIGIRIGNGRKHWLGREPWNYVLSPHRVTFKNVQDGLSYSISYDFCLNEPALVQRITVRNVTYRIIPVEVYTHVKAPLRTCQTYARKDSALIDYLPNLHLFSAYFDYADTYRASVFIHDVGDEPLGYFSNFGSLAATDSGTSSWVSSSIGLTDTSNLWTEKLAPPIAASIYRKILQRGDSLSIIKVIASCRREEVEPRAIRLRYAWREEIDGYNRFVEEYAKSESHLTTGDAQIDRSAVWARGLLAANQHYLDGKIVPMPCPAEYNFFFTHDLLLTNLGAVNFDLPRVKRDLLYVASLAKDGIIPHAYYWRDDGFKTEYCDSTNWNHLWFIIASARYLRHSGDDSTGKALYPLLTRSLSAILSQRKSDNLMYAYRPDWWDIGRREGPRAYISILTIRALRDYVYMSSFLQQPAGNLLEYESLAEAMGKSLCDRLWDAKLNYLINYNDSLEDRHYYMGSLLAPVYHVLDAERSAKLLETASEKILRYPVGVMVVSPADFHTDSMRAFFRFVGNEAGDPYIYANGGIWPHANANYALALNEIGKTDEALKFVKDVMTLDGVAASPNGLPAMYEYRVSDSSSRDFGKIDKPSFMWAAGFYMNVLYALSGFQDNEWNLSLSGRLPLALDSVRCSYTFGHLQDVRISGKTNRLLSCLIDGVPYPSLVLPLHMRDGKEIAVRYGVPTIPYLSHVNAVLNDVRYDRNSKKMVLDITSFNGHRSVAGIITPLEIETITLDGKPISDFRRTIEADALLNVEIAFVGAATRQLLEIQFK